MTGATGAAPRFSFQPKSKFMTKVVSDLQKEPTSSVMSLEYLIKYHPNKVSMSINGSGGTGAYTMPSPQCHCPVENCGA